MKKNRTLPEALMKLREARMDLAWVRQLGNEKCLAEKWRR